MTASTLATMEPLPLVPRLNSWSGRKIAVSSLRPLDVVSGENTWDGARIVAQGTYIVIQNSGALQKVELRTPSGLTTLVANYADVPGLAPLYRGKAVRRRWYGFVPVFLRRFVGEYTMPQNGA